MKSSPSITGGVKLGLAGIGAALALLPSLAAEEAAPKATETNSVAPAPAKAVAEPVKNPAPAAGSTNAAPATAEASSTALDYSAFRQIADRNIFNANRSSRSARNGERPKQVQVDTFTVVGTMTYAKGDVAFFDGSSGSYRKAVKLGDSVAGHKVVGITAEEVRLEAGEKKVTLKVGGQMRREDEGPWEMASAGVSHSAAGAAPGSGSGSFGASDGDSGGEVSDVLKRLLQKRAQEEKNENQ